MFCIHFLYFSFLFFLQGKEIIEYYINELESDGITYIPPFQDKEGVPIVEVTETENACSASSSRNNSLTQSHSAGVSSNLSDNHQTAGKMSFSLLFDNFESYFINIFVDGWHI